MEEFLQDLQLPGEIKPLFVSLANHLAHLNMKWDFYKELFINKNNSIILADTARIFFVSLEQLFRYDITLAICNLSDHSKYTKKSGKTLFSLSLETLINRCNANTTTLDLFKEFRKQSEPFRRLRNRVVAHLDLDTAVNLKAKSLPIINEVKINKILQLAGNILSDISAQYGNTQEIVFVPLVMAGASDLVYWLSKGRAAYKNYMKNLKEGRIPERF